MPQARSIGEILRDAQLGRLETVFAEGREPYDLIGATERLFDLLEERQVDYVLVGGMAMLQYVDGRNTRDIDLILDVDALARLPEIVISAEDADFARGEFDGVQIDVLKTANEVFNFVRVNETEPVDIGGRSTPCATRQGLLILKLFALPSLYRQGESTRAAIYEADLAALLASGGVDTEAALAQLSRDMLASDISALRSLLADIPERGAGFETSP